MVLAPLTAFAAKALPTNQAKPETQAAELLRKFEQALKTAVASPNRNTVNRLKWYFGEAEHAGVITQASLDIVYHVDINDHHVSPETSIREYMMGLRNGIKYDEHGRSMPVPESLTDESCKNAKIYCVYVTKSYDVFSRAVRTDIQADRKCWFRYSA